MEPHKQALIDSLTKSLGIISKACNALGISRQTYYDWLEKDPEFKQQAENIKEYVIDHVEDKLHELINDKDTAAVIFFMKTQGKKRGYVERTEHAGVADAPLVGKSDAELEKLFNDHLNKLSQADVNTGDTGSDGITEATGQS